MVEGLEHGGIGLRINGLAIGGLHEFEQPGREVVPEEVIDLHQGFAQAILGVEVGHLGGTVAQAGFKPLDSERSGFALGGFGAHLPTLDKAEGIPYLIIKVAALLAEGFVEEDVVASRRGEHHAHTHAVGSVLLDEGDGVGTVAQLLGHLAAQVVAHDTREIDIAEGHLARVFHTSHNHAGHPEEDDVGPCHEVGRGIVVGQFGIVGMVDTIEEADGPEPRTEPSVEGIFVLAQLLVLQVLEAWNLARLLASLKAVHRHDESFLLALGCGQVEGGDAVAPPELGTDTPVVDILQPVAIGRHVFLRVELDVAVQYGRQGDIGKVLHG